MITSFAIIANLSSRNLLSFIKNRLEMISSFFRANNSNPSLTSNKSNIHKISSNLRTVRFS